MDLIFCRRGQLGLGTLNIEEEPVLIEALAGIKVNITLVHNPSFLLSHLQSSLLEKNLWFINSNVNYISLYAIR